MDTTQISTKSFKNRRSSLLLLTSLVFTLSGVAGGVMLLASGSFPLLERPFLLPWIILMTFLALAPFGSAITRRELRVYNPVLYYSLIFFLPGFLLGGIQLVIGTQYSWVMSLISDEEYFLPLTILYCAIGFVSFWWGFARLVGQRAGQMLSRRLPSWDWTGKEVMLPAIVILAAGEVLRLMAVAIGTTGYNLVDTVPAFGAALVAFAGLGTWSSFLLWLMIFRQTKLSLPYALLTGLLTLVIIYNQLLSGGRSALFASVVMIALAYAMSGRLIRLRVVAAIGALTVIVLLAGMVYGTTFRMVKGSEAATDLQGYFQAVDSTLRAIGNQPSQDRLSFGFDNLIERVDVISQPAVIVANHERLRHLEEQYNLANNIWTYTWTAFVPRFVWRDKPLISDARAMGALYFGTGNNSFIQTPMVDLLRNYGPIGIPLGMALLGVVLRLIYSALVEQVPIHAGRAAMYYLLLTSISFEGFYGTILPGLLRNGLIAVIGAGLVSVSVRLSSRRTQR